MGTATLPERDVYAVTPMLISGEIVVAGLQ